MNDQKHPFLHMFNIIRTINVGLCITWLQGMDCTRHIVLHDQSLLHWTTRIYLNINKINKSLVTHRIQIERSCAANTISKHIDIPRDYQMIYIGEHQAFKYVRYLYYETWFVNRSIKWKCYSSLWILIWNYQKYSRYDCHIWNNILHIGISIAMHLYGWMYI